MRRWSVRSLLVCLFLLMPQLWTRTETVASGQITGTLTDFPAFISRTHNDFRVTGSGGHVASASGHDLVLYTDSGLTTIAKQETELYNSATGAIAKHVKVASAAVGSVLYWGYGDTGISTSQDDKTNVWNSAYRAVYHFGDGTTLGLTDSTSNAYNLTNNNSATATAGQVHGAVNLASASSQSLSVASFSLSGTNLTVECWAYATNFNQNGMLVHRAVVNAEWALFFETTFKLRGGSTTELSTTRPSDNNWHHLVGTITGTSGELYKDGTSATTGSVTAIPNTSNTLDIGRYSGSGTGYFFNGKIDEVRVSNVVRSAAWIAATYNTLSAPTTFWTLGSEASLAVFLPRPNPRLMQAVHRAATY